MAEPLSFSRVYTLAETAGVAEALLAFGGDCRIWLLHGEPGAGKTSLIREVCRQLGVDPGQVNSPTFGLMNKYTGKEDIFHFDLYRINRESELFDLGMDEVFASGSWCFVEWPELLDYLRPGRWLNIRLLHPPGDGTVRLLEAQLEITPTLTHR